MKDILSVPIHSKNDLCVLKSCDIVCTVLVKIFAFCVVLSMPCQVCDTFTFSSQHRISSPLSPLTSSSPGRCLWGLSRGCPRLFATLPWDVSPLSSYLPGSSCDRPLEFPHAWPLALVAWEYTHLADRLIRIIFRGFT